MTIFGGRQKCENKLCCHLQQQQQQQGGGEEEEEEQHEDEEEEEEKEEEKEEEPNFDKKICGRMLTSCGMTRTSHCALHLRTTRAHYYT